MSNQNEWASEARDGVQEEQRRLNENGPSLERYRKARFNENRLAFVAQAEWYKRHAHPLAESKEKQCR
ncbi:hypothetical protein [Ruegeria faecimaris]|uniref:hypothetical protein n=1 Tax=Ruegeria faecimaris TaxID=686389 RepID=UPI00249323FE|nr:hypothetical protein [Ruegeria faecimaris]